MNIEQAYELTNYMMHLEEIEYDHKLKKQAKQKRLEKIADYVIYLLAAVVVCVAAVKILVV